MTEEEIVIEKGEGWVLATLNRPSTFKSWYSLTPDPMGDGFISVIDGMIIDNRLKVLTIKGTDRGFVSGANVPEFVEMATNPPVATDLIKRIAKREDCVLKVVEKITLSPKPTIAAITGANT